MKVLVIGSTGRAGRLLVEYALEQGHEVTAFARHVGDYPLAHERLRFFTGDVLYPPLLDAVMPGHDAVCSVIGIRQFSGEITLLSTGARNVIASMERAGLQRLLTLTGAGILQENQDELLMESLSFPPNLMNISLDQLRVYHALQESRLDWTIVAPSFMHQGPRTGKYVAEADYFPRNCQNRISVEDVADFMTRELDERQFVGKRVGIAWPMDLDEEEGEAA
jgi:putative NADH-flavin reductase